MRSSGATRSANVPAWQRPFGKKRQSWPGGMHDARGADERATIKVTLEEAYHGGERSLSLKSGRGPARTLKVKIPKGVSSGTKVRVKGKGGPGANGGPAGDLYVEVSVGSHPVFGRSGKRNLTIDVPVSYPEAALGATHPDTLGSVGNLANLYRDQGKYEQAEPLYVRALEGREAALGAAHPSTLASVNNLAILYYQQGKYEQAEPLYVRALEGYEAALGAAHPDTLRSVNNLAALYLQPG